MRERLTPRQQETLSTILKIMRSEQRPPTIREIGLALGIASPNGVVTNLRALQRKGWISMDNRSIRVLEHDSCPFCGAAHQSTEMQS